MFQTLTDQNGVWSIKNKYYSCDVNIQVHQQSNNASSQENLKIGATLWYSDNLKSDKVIERLDQWQKELKAYLKVKESSEEHSSSKEVKEEGIINVEVQLLVVEKLGNFSVILLFYFKHQLGNIISTHQVIYFYIK